MSITQPDLPTAVPELTIAQEGFEAPSPQLLLLNDALATDLGFNPAWLRSEAGLRFLTGHGTGTKESMPVATAYAGHQFGNFAGVLGDGRALLLATAEGAQG
nr:protein adenylyltransferase SelO family protein [Corynebacterium lactis]